MQVYAPRGTRWYFRVRAVDIEVVLDGYSRADSQVMTLAVCVVYVCVVTNSAVRLPRTLLQSYTHSEFSESVTN